MNLTDTFLNLCRPLEAQWNAVYTEVLQDKRMTSVSFYFRQCRVDLVYSRKWETLAPPSVLFARIYLSKNNPVYLHLPELIGFLGVEDYRACYFPYIESPQRMADAFAALTELLRDYIPKAEHLADTGADMTIMERWATDGFFPDEKREENPDEKIDWEAMELFCHFQECILVSRHTTEVDAYRAFLDGDREKAIQKYEKLRKNGLSVYEEGLLDFLKSPRSRDFQPMPPQCRSDGAYQKAQKLDKTDLLGFVLCYAVCAAFFCGLIAVIDSILSWGTLYYFGVGWWFGFLLALAPAFFGYLAFQRFLRQKLGGSVAFLDVQKNPKFTQRLSGVMGGLFAIGCLAFCILVPPMSSRYYADHAVLYSEDYDGHFTYDQVREVYYIHGRYNDYDELVERASCVLILQDGRQFDLDCDGSPEEQLEMVSHLLPDLPVQELASDRDLPPLGLKN